MGGAYVQIIGAETLKAGTPVDLGWLPLFLLALALPPGRSAPARAAPVAVARRAAAALPGRPGRAAKPS